MPDDRIPAPKAAKKQSYGAANNFSMVTAVSLFDGRGLYV